ncbi:MAG: capsid protein [Comamonadaceae bacterium]|nr:capsid protein [Comamonadaceae bacterium]
MANATTLNIGQVNGAGATDALFLKIFSGEILTAFETATVTRDKHFVRTIAHGKSASFPATWKVTAGYHTPGTEIVGQSSNVNERVISIDDLLLSSIFIPNIDEAKNHFDYRSIYSREAGIALATNWDKNILQTGLLAARASATVSGAFGGTSLTSATTLYRTSATDLVAGHFAAAQAMDEKDVPQSSARYSFIRPAQYYLLAQLKDLVNKDYAEGNGNQARAEVLKVADISLVKTNNLPVTAVNTGPAAYQGDFSKTAALIMTPDAVGTCKLMDLQSEMQYDMRRQGTLIVAKYLMGHGILRPECAVELKTTA